MDSCRYLSCTVSIKCDANANVTAILAWHTTFYCVEIACRAASTAACLFRHRIAIYDCSASAVCLAGALNIIVVVLLYLFNMFICGWLDY